MSIVQQVRDLVTPLLDDLGLEIYDLEHTGGTLRLTIDRPGGVDLEAIALATRLVSRELDHTDPLPGHYTLEVTSPGLERTLRTPEHFRRAVSSAIAVRTHAHVDGERRAQGILREADDDGITMSVTDTPGAGERRLAYDDIERARMVFTWAPTPKPGGAKKQHTDSQRKAGAS
jgi:ribosome maturation factor RimP